MSKHNALSDNGNKQDILPASQNGQKFQIVDPILPDEQIKPVNYSIPIDPEQIKLAEQPNIFKVPTPQRPPEQVDIIIMQKVRDSAETSQLHPSPSQNTPTQLEQKLNEQNKVTIEVGTMPQQQQGIITQTIQPNISYKVDITKLPLVVQSEIKEIKSTMQDLSQNQDPSKNPSTSHIPTHRTQNTVPGR